MLMSEITKLYKNANIKICERKQGFTLKDCTDRDCKECGYYIIPPFTAEKLIKLEMFLINKGDFDIKKGSVDITFESFTSCIAGLINNLWQDLTEDKKQQVKGILE